MKKSLKQAIVTFVFLSVISVTCIAQIQVGASLKAGTTGLGGDAILSLNPKMDIRAGFDKMNFGYGFNLEEQGINYNANVKANFGAISALFDYSLTKWLFVSAGVGYNLFEIEVSGEAAEDMPYGDISIPIESIGIFNFKANPGLKFSPYWV